MWIKKDTSKEHRLEVVNEDNNWEAIIDGCIHFNRYYNGYTANDKGVPEEDMDYIHICDLDEYIEELKLLKEEAIKHFGKDWN